MVGVYRFEVKPPADNSYVKSIRVQGQELVDRPFEIQNNRHMTNVEILISPEGGQVSGVVKEHTNGDLVSRAMVILYPLDTAKRGIRRYTKTSHSDDQGIYSIKGIVPGEYAICALLNYDSDSEGDPTNLAQVGINAKRIVIEIGSTLNESLDAYNAPAKE